MMDTRYIAGKAVGALGFGCMNVSHAYGNPPAREAAQALLRRAVDMGVRHFDTAALYGFGSNEKLVGETLAPYRKEIFLASKCGMTGVDGKRVIDGRPETLMTTIDDSLRNLRTDFIDLYYLHRWDKSVPIEDSVGALACMVDAGKIGAIGLSEVSERTLRNAHAVHPIAAVQTEYSLWTRNPELGVLDACADLGAAFVAFSPVGRGFLSGGVDEAASMAEKDIRRGMPRFQGANFEANQALFRQLQGLAEEGGCTPAQLSLRWLLAEAPHIIPIPGTRSENHLIENQRTLELDISPELLALAGKLINQSSVKGERYPPATQAEIDTEEF
jgi:aryl-alcohol dehydrogenase-like predicted oxidoreductase